MAGLGDRIENGLRALAQRMRGGREAPEMVLLSPEATIKAHQAEPGKVAVTSLLDGGRLFAVEGTLEAALTRVEGGQDTTLLRLPIQVGEGRCWLRLRVTRSAPPGEWPTLRRVRAVAVPDGLEFQFRSDNAPESAEVDLEFTLDPGLRLSEFRPFEDLQPLFRDLPQVSEMAAYLRACMHHRRSQVQILTDLADSLRSNRIVDAVEQIRRRHTAVIMGSQRLADLSSRMASHRQDMSPTVLGAACLAAELEGRTLAPDVLAEMLEDAIPYEPSDEVASRLEAALVDRFRGLLSDDPGASPLERAMVRVAHALTQDSPLRILSDLASQSRAGTAGSLVRLLRRGLRDPGRLADPSQAALRALLARHGRPITAGTMAGLCLFVEAELGLLAWEQMEALLGGEDRPPTSAYALAAVAGACDLELRGFKVPPEQVPALVRLASDRALVRAGDHFETLRPLSGQEPVLVLAHLPVLENLQGADLDVLLRARRRVFPCYRSSLDGHLRWAAVREGEYHFAGRVLGRLDPTTPEALAGREDVLTAWSDARGHVHFRHHPAVQPEDLEPAAGDLRWTGDLVELPDDPDLPDVLVELNRHDLAELEDPRRLPSGLLQLKEALEDLGPDREAADSLHHHPRLLSFVRLGLVSPGMVRVLCDVADRRTREAILEAARRPDGLREELAAHPALLFLLELAETVETGLLAVAASLAPAAEAPALFRALASRLRDHARSGQTAVRWAAARLLGTRLGQEVMEDAVEVLGWLRQDASRGVSSAATASLVSLALTPTRPAPPVLEIRPGRTDRQALWAQDVERLVSQITDHVRGYVLFPQEESPALHSLVREDQHSRRPSRPRIEALARLVAGLNLALASDPRAGRLEIRPPRQEPVLIPLEEGSPCGPWRTSGQGEAMADRLGFSPFFEHLCLADHVPLEDLEVFRHLEAGEPERYDPRSQRFQPALGVRRALDTPVEELRSAARRLIQRLALAAGLEEQVLRLLACQWDQLQVGGRAS